MREESAVRVTLWEEWDVQVMTEGERSTAALGEWETLETECAPGVFLS